MPILAETSRFASNPDFWSEIRVTGSCTSAIGRPSCPSKVTVLTRFLAQTPCVAPDRLTVIWQISMVAVDKAIATREWSYQ